MSEEFIEKGRIKQRAPCQALDEHQGVIKESLPQRRLQRPTRICGFGMLTSFFASLLVLTSIRATRRR